MGAVQLPPKGSWEHWHSWRQLAEWTSAGSSKDRTLLDAVKNMQMELQLEAPPRRPARPYLISSLLGLEILVCIEGYSNYTRLIGWVMLLVLDGDAG